jgi:hypothetical protein
LNAAAPVDLPVNGAIVEDLYDRLVTLESIRVGRGRVVG